MKDRPLRLREDTKSDIDNDEKKIRRRDMFGLGSAAVAAATLTMVSEKMAWATMLNGSARITAVDQDGKSFVSDVGEGDLRLFPPGVPHSIQGLGPVAAAFCWYSTMETSTSSTHS